ncbi:MAG: hypothetical protein JOY80_07380, partial [Candidatus Dormibacteraeota bacterium]|nr:hypothetical protein [Candidatus Dormibacteraeota bacterium]
AWWLLGRGAAWLATKALLAGCVVALLASAYWLVPAYFWSSGAAAGQLASLNSWTWTESRATLANGFWLNSSWGWTYPEYYPYAASYMEQPLQFLKFAFPAIAFAALLLPSSTTVAGVLRTWYLRVAAVAAAVALLLIVFGTGTQLPGSVIFDPLYNLPYGWLLREPGRFLDVAALAYAVLIAVGIEHVARSTTRRIAAHRVRFRLRAHIRLPPALACCAAMVALAAFVPASPLLTGAVIADSRPLLPSAHVTIPGYWYEMGSFVEANVSASDSVVVLPADTYYQVAYTWGYYGSDSFISGLMTRRTIAAIPGGYVPTAQQLLSAVQQLTSDIEQHDWVGVDRIGAALHSPWLLIRGDVQQSLSNRTTSLPESLAATLRSDPYATVAHTSGPLTLVRLDVNAAAGTPATYATVASDQPDLQVLRYLPAGTALVSTRAAPGITNVIEVPSVNEWLQQGGTLTSTVAEPPGSQYSLVALNSDLTALGVRALPAPGRLDLSVPVTQDVPNGDFAAGPWRAAVSDCNATVGGEAAGLSAVVRNHGGPGGAPAFVLSAQQDVACESQVLRWNDRPFVLSFDVKHDSGAAPSICVWEVELSTCAVAGAVPDQPSWAHYSALITPDAGVSTLALFLYTEGSGVATPSANEFARVRALELPSDAPLLDVIATPDSVARDPSPLMASDQAFDDRWTAPGEHVLVDGLFNGWIGLSAESANSIVYRPSSLIRVSYIVSAASVALVSAAVVAPWLWRVVRRKRLARRL